MVLKRLESRLCLLLLLLLLGLVLLVVSVQIPPNLTPSQWFAIQHLYNKAYPRCNAAMRVVNSYTGRCKNRNTFLYTSFIGVVHVCANPNTACNTGHTNCHNSSSRVSITYCNLTTPAKNYTQCRYQMTGGMKFYRVACNNRTPQDNTTYPVVPVHLDGIF
ncbi:non-secretory ribonuclease [Acomys russatus]|uniref:non-secretory ribonuclease n=1 Tax=Acomys russatus TaxID=60746 RepID=UPI0021E22D6B|nr:non-secretory ribonuclease [Acomys russatus]